MSESKTRHRLSDVTWQYGYLKTLLKTLTLWKEQVLNTELTSIRPTSNLKIFVSDTHMWIHVYMYMHTHGHAYTETYTCTYTYTCAHPWAPAVASEAETVLESLELEFQWSAATQVLGIAFYLTPYSARADGALNYWAIFPFCISCTCVHVCVSVCAHTIFIGICGTESLKTDLHAFWWTLRWDKLSVLWRQSQEKWWQLIRSCWALRTESDRVHFQQQKIIWRANTSVLPR